MDLIEQSQLNFLIQINKQNKLIQLMNLSEDEQPSIFGEKKKQVMDIEVESPKAQYSVVYINNINVKKELNIKLQENNDNTELILEQIKQNIIQEQQLIQSKILDQTDFTLSNIEQKQTTKEQQQQQINKFEKQQIKNYDFTVKNESQNNLSQESQDNKFGKLKENYIKESYQKKQSISSSLRKSLSALSKNPLQKFSQMMNLKVYFFNNQIEYEVIINKENTVEEVIEITIDFYFNNPNTDKSLMKKGMDKQFYELRYIDEEDNFSPIPDFQALDKKRKFSSYNIDKIAFCEIKHDYKQNINPEQLLEQISKQKKPENVVLNVNFQAQNFKTNISINTDQTIKDIFAKVKSKIEINPKNVIVKVKNIEEDQLNNSCTIQDELEEVSLDLPIKYLKSKEITVEKKIYLDEPNRSKKVAKQLQQQYLTQTSISTVPLQEHILMNEVEVTKYEEFEIIKINDKGKRQQRILGIDLYKIHNKINPNQKSFFNSFFSKNVNNPLRQTSEIQDIKQTNNLSFQIIYNNESQKKIYSYEAQNESDLQKIFTKIKNIISYHQKIQYSSYKKQNTKQQDYLYYQ